MKIYKKVSYVVDMPVSDDVVEVQNVVGIMSQERLKRLFNAQRAADDQLARLTYEAKFIEIGTPEGF